MKQTELGEETHAVVMQALEDQVEFLRMRAGEFRDDAKLFAANGDEYQAESERLNAKDYDAHADMIGTVLLSVRGGGRLVVAHG